MVNDYTMRWLKRAVGDLQVMRNELALMPPENRVNEAVCFHAQQSVEKLLKAYLAEKNVEFGKTHNLQILIRLCAGVEGEFASLDVGDLTDYAVEIRYPDDFYEPAPDEVAESARLAEKVKEFVLRKLLTTEEDIRKFVVPD